MGGAKLEGCAPGVQAKDIDVELQMCDDSFSNDRISIDYESYEYRDCAASCIGRGSFGHVFRGIDNTSGMSVAIKKMAKINVKPNELKVMKSVKSSFLVGLVDICVDSADSVYIIMELCDIDLDQHLRYYSVNGALSKNNLRLLMDNPQNILIKYDPIGRGFESAKISDFGISRILTEEQSEALSNVAGTFYYMAPEVGANLLRTCEYDYQVDMWSLGCLFYQLFLYAAGGNYEAYEKPELPADTEEEIEQIVSSLLEIDSTVAVNKRCSTHPHFAIYRDSQTTADVT
uniref:Protein kinase domain-containing protein n=1 Tax=Parascaris equorum TaxID=6256 RepID=A0A914RS97_PAREQ